MNAHFYRVLKDHTTSSGVQQGQALDSLRDKLHETEDTLRREQESLRLVQVGQMCSMKMVSINPILI